MTTVAITGISGYVGQALLAMLEADSRVSRIIGVDIAGPSIGSSKLEFYELDVRDARLPKIVAGCDALVHLALMNGTSLNGTGLHGTGLHGMGRDLAIMRSVNVDGSNNVVDCAVKASVPAIVFASTVRVYGAHEDNEFPLRETSALRPDVASPEAMHTRIAESSMDCLREEHREIAVATLRFPRILGPGSGKNVLGCLPVGACAGIKGFAPPVQVIHVSDAASAIVAAIFGRWDSEYNCAAEHWMERDEFLALTGRRLIEIPQAFAAWVGERAHAMQFPFGPADISEMMFPQVMDFSKIAAKGWKPFRTNRQTVLEAAALGRFGLRRLRI